MGKRGGFPGGNFGGMNMNSLMKQAKKMQEDLERSQEEIVAMDFEATAGGGAVKVIVTGAKVIKSLIIKPEVVDPEDTEMLQDLIMACINEALRKVDDANAAKMGKFGLPGLM